MKLLGSGRTADVYDQGIDRVLRRYRNGISAEPEAAVMTYVGGFGYPVPKVFQVAGPDMLMERLHGPTMLQAMVTGLLAPAYAIEQLAALHRALHELPPRLSTDPAYTVVHLDLHPENVIMTERGPMVIDWSNAGDGPAGLDVAVSALIMAEVAVDPDHPVATAARQVVPLFLSCAGRPTDALVDVALAMRLANPVLGDAEKQRLPQAADLLR
jgi:aminoglycoside phosphotransferase (APT) family kinase protein